MPRVLFSISYSIVPDTRETYLSLVKSLKQHLASDLKKDYMVLESKGRRNHFMEVFQSESLEAFDALEDNQDEKTQELVRSIQACVDRDGMKLSLIHI